MVTRAVVLFLAAFTLAIVSTGVLRAHEGHDHKIMGTVTMAAADHVMLEDRDGNNVTIKVTKDTRVKSKPAMKVEEIKAGTRVVVTASQAKDKSFTAKIIEVGAAPAARNPSSGEIVWGKPIYEGGGINNGWVDYRDHHLGPELKAFENPRFGHSNTKVSLLGE